MKDFTNKHFNIFFINLSIILFLLCGCIDHTSLENDIYYGEISHSDNNQNNEIAVSAPPFSDGIFPCSDCHADEETNPQRRILGMHEEIDESFNHDNENRWCLDCHDADNRDSLKLASGRLLTFEESYKLCGQCHGDKLRDWKVGVHGKRTGEWNGEKQYLLCVHCHNPHSPKFKKLAPYPPPVKQEDLIDQD